MKYDRIGLGTLVVRGYQTTTRLSNETGLRETLDKSIKTLVFNLKDNTTREEYIAWRTAWRALYRDVSDYIYNLKTYRDGHGPVGDNVWETIRPHRQSDVMVMRRYAQHLLILRRFSKILAGRARANALSLSITAKAA